MVDTARRFIVVLCFLLLMMTFVHTDAYSGKPVDRVIVSVDIADAAPASNITSEAMIEAKHILRAAYERPVTQAEVYMRLEAMMRSEGADGGLAFPTLVMSGSELTAPHGDPFDDASHVIDPSTDPVVMIDMGCKYNGFCSDVTRTFFFETATQEMFDAYNAVLTAHEAVIAAVGPGVVISDLDAILDAYLANYTGVPGVSLLTYWGHGVGEFVHVEPTLYNSTEQLEVDDVVAIEPGIYFDTGWAVRIEDTVRVTATGVEVLSNVSRSLEDVMVLPSQPHLAANIMVSDYDYGSETTVEVSITDSATRSVHGVDWFDGYSWIPMVLVAGLHFNLSYNLDYSYSGRLECMSRVRVSNDTYYFMMILTASVEASGLDVKDPPLQYSDEIIPPGTTIILTYTAIGAEMIRLRFNSMSGGHDQILIEDSSSRAVIDYRLYSKSYFWTPWVSGDTLKIHVVQTEPESLGGVAPFSFTVERIEFFDADLPPPTTTTTTPTPTPTTSTTTTTTTSTPYTTPKPPDEDLNIQLLLGASMSLGILALIILWRRRSSLG